MMKKLMNKLIALGAMMFFGLTGCSNLNDAGNTLALDNSTQPDRCVVTVDTDAARAVIVAEYGASDINQWSLSATNVADATDTYTTGNKTSLSELSLTIVKDETYDFTLTGIVGTAEVPGAVKGEIAARKITGNTRLSFTVKPSDATSTADPDAKGMAELKFDITGMDVMEDSMTGHGYKFVAKGQSGNAARKTENLPLEFDETAKTFKAKDAVLPTGIWELRLLCSGTTYCEGIFFAVEAGLTTKVTVVKTNLSIPGTGEITGIFKDGIKNFTPAVPEDMLAPSKTVQFEFDCDGLGYKIAFENNAEGTPVYKLCLQEAEIGYVDTTEDYAPYMSANIDGDIYTFAMGSYACAIDTANKTYSWIFLDRYEDSADTFTNVHIYVNGTDIIGDLTYKTFVKPTAEDMLAANTGVQIDFFSITEDMPLSVKYKNDASATPVVQSIKAGDEDMTEVLGRFCFANVTETEYLFTFGVYFLTIDTENKTYTWLNNTSEADANAEVSDTHIYVNGADIISDLSYKTFVKPTAATMLEAGTTVRFDVTASGYEYLVTFKNNASGMPVLQQILVTPPRPAVDVTESYKDRFTADIKEGIYKYNHGDFELTIDTTNSTYTWCNNEADAKDSIYAATIYVNNFDITEDLTYKAFSNVSPEDMLKPDAETKISFTSGTSNYEITWVINQYGYAGFKYPGGIVVNGQDKTEDYGSTCTVSIKNDVINYHHFTVDFDVDPVNRTFKWYQRFGAPPKMDNTTVTVNGTDITELLTDVTPSVEDIVAPNSTIQVNFKEAGASYKLVWKNDAEGRPVVQSFAQGDIDMTYFATVDVLNGVSLFSFGMYRLRINPKNKTYTWFTKDYADALSEIENTNITINGIMFTDSFTYETYVPVEALLAPYVQTVFGFEYHGFNYTVTCNNDDWANPSIDFDMTAWDGNFIYEGFRSKWSVINQEGTKYILTMYTSDAFALEIDVANKTYTWYNTETLKDSQRECGGISIYVFGNKNIIPALTYKTYVKSN